MNASISFMVPHAKHREEKPYAIQYEPHDPLPRINYEHEMISNIPVADIRMQSHPCSLRDEGFTVLTMESALTADEFIDEQKLKEVYAAEVRSLLTKHLGCSQVYFHECVVRKKSSNVESQSIHQSKEAPGENFGQPITFAHVDYTRDAVVQLIQQLGGKNSEILLSRRFQVLNVWKPIRGPLRDWPLAVCDMRSIEVAKDLVATDAVYTDGFVEGYQVHYNANQRWFYLSEHQPNELLIFQNVDSETPGCVAHSAFETKSPPDGAPPRESIELRCLVFY